MSVTESLSPAELYDSYYGAAIFDPLSVLFIERAAPRMGERVLELACGTGIVTRRVAPLLGTNGSILAVDINPAMLEIARRYAPQVGAPVEWRQDDAVTAALPREAFDLALCQQGLQFFSDRLAALRSLYNALVPGGRLVLALWQGVEAQGLSDFAAVEARYLAPLGVPAEALNAPFSLGDAAELRWMLETAGFSEIEIEPYAFEARFSDPANFVRRVESAYGAVIPAFVADRAAFDLFVENVERDAREIVARLTEGDTVRFPMPLHFARARKA